MYLARHIIRFSICYLIFSLCIPFSLSYLLSFPLRSSLRNSGLEKANIFVDTALLSMYSRTGSITKAVGVFERMKKNAELSGESLGVISYNAMLAAYPFFPSSFPLFFLFLFLFFSFLELGSFFKPLK